MEINEAYNEWSEQYDTNQNKTRDLDQRATIETLSEYTFSSVLELGCGTGKNTVWLSERAEQVTALDFSEGMLAQARKKTNLHSVQFLQADLTKPWPVPDHTFDLITCNLVLEHISDLDFIFRQAKLKLRPGGLFFISELHPFRQYTGSKARYETEKGTTELKVFVHSISAFITCAFSEKFSLLELKEKKHAEDESALPRLLTLLFQKA